MNDVSDKINIITRYNFIYIYFNSFYLYIDYFIFLFYHGLIENSISGMNREVNSRLTTIKTDHNLYKYGKTRRVFYLNAIV